MPITIHNKSYITVAERLVMLHEDQKGSPVEITTEVLEHSPVVIKATLKTKNGLFTGISAANPAKAIEKQSPYEVAETSAVGRALGFAGYGATESVASADEVNKAIDQGDEPFPSKNPARAENNIKSNNFKI